MAFLDDDDSPASSVQAAVTKILNADIAVGVCPLPLYDFSSSELDLFLRNADPEAIRESLRSHDIAQYFFPAPDHLALGLVERNVTNPADITRLMATVPAEGHPFAASEFVSPDVKLAEILDALVKKNLITEGEVAFELTPAGHSIRSTVRFKPRESLLSKIISRFNVSLNLKDLFGG
jgi:hypothetical protein